MVWSKQPLEEWSYCNSHNTCRAKSMWFCVRLCIEQIYAIREYGAIRLNGIIRVS